MRAALIALLVGGFVYRIGFHAVVFLAITIGFAIYKLHRASMPRRSAPVRGPW